MEYLSKVTTKDMVKELSKRDAVKSIQVEPDVEFAVDVGGNSVLGIPASGPAKILIIWD